MDLLKTNSNSYFTPVVLKSQKPIDAATSETDATSQAAARAQLGRLDGLLSNAASNIPKVRQIKDSKKIAAILLETNIVELQRHLLTITVQNQVRASLSTKTPLVQSKIKALNSL